MPIVREPLMSVSEPPIRPINPRFSSGPSAKRPGWRAEHLNQHSLGRSHRAPAAHSRIAHAIDLTRQLLDIPPDYLVAIVPGSDTGAVEMALWSLLGPRGVDVLAWEHFGGLWASDIVDQLHLPDVRILTEPGDVRDRLARVDWRRDVVFTWNGTATGTRVPDGEWIDDAREGLAICDATSAVFGERIPIRKLDVITFSWQKCLGGEAAHGILVLSPRAAERVLSYNPPWPMPKVFRLKDTNGFLPGLFSGNTINTVSLLCVEDAIDSMEWALSIGGLETLVARVHANYGVIADWEASCDWAAFLEPAEPCRSRTSVCIRITDPSVLCLDESRQRALLSAMATRLDNLGVAFDISGFRTAPPSIRIWCGPTVESGDLLALMPWLDWAFGQERGMH